MPLARATAMLVALAAMTGCGGDEPTAVARGHEVAIVLDEFLIAPQNVNVAPGPVTLRIADRGRLRHQFRLWGGGGEPVVVRTIFPGDEVVRTADLKPGEYRMVCTVSNHAELGMTGRLVVR
jgi:plastocyanin